MQWPSHFRLHEVHGLSPGAWRLQDKCHPQTIAVCQTRADGLGLTVEVGPEDGFDFGKDVCGALLQYPATDGSVHDYKVSMLPPHIDPPRNC